MGRYLVKRLISGILSFLIFTSIVFFTFNALIPYDFVDTLSLQLAGTGNREALREELGLNLPLWQQYLNWLGDLAQGNLGREFTLFGQGAAVTDLLQTAIPSTLLIFITGAALAFWIGYSLGKITAWRSSNRITAPITASAIAFYTAFPPWLAFLVGYILVIQLGILPARAGSRDLSRRLWFDAPVSETAVMGFMFLSIIIMLILVWLCNRLAHRWRKDGLPTFLAILIFIIGVYLIWTIFDYTPYVLDILVAASVPFITFFLLSFGDTLLLTQTTMAGGRHEMYVQTARGKGLPSKQIRDKHVARNAILPVLSRFVINLPWLLTAIVIVEYATNWPGVGNLLFQAIYNQNSFIYMDILIIVGLLSLIARLILDVAYAYLDPRIRFGGQTI
ncbi:MAG: ABC transporter permease [Chloroflexi bacterium]|nr:ABC transporter permease [Chloroflexota bacterium]